MNEQQRTKAEAVLKHLALVQLEVKAIGKLLGEDAETLLGGATNKAFFDKTASHIRRMGLIITDIQERSGVSTLAWEERVQGSRTVP
jgi:hypothetical protein